MARKLKRTQRVYDKHSEVLGERYCVEIDHAYFENGANYTKNEQRILGGMEPEKRKKIHKLKTIFGGKLLC